MVVSTYDTTINDECYNVVSVISTQMLQFVSRYKLASNSDSQLVI
jgi:hypothetical protein